MKWVALCLIMSVGCSSTFQTSGPLIPEKRWVEEEELLEHCEKIDLDVPGSEHQVEAYEPKEGQKPDWPGILVSEARANRDALCRIAYRELRSRYSADRGVWKAHRDAYETKIKEDAQRIEELQPGFWDEYGEHVVGILGFTLGVISAIAMANALNDASE